MNSIDRMFLPTMTQNHSRFDLSILEPIACWQSRVCDLSEAELQSNISKQEKRVHSMTCERSVIASIIFLGLGWDSSSDTARTAPSASGLRIPCPQPRFSL